MPLKINKFTINHGIHDINTSIEFVSRFKKWTSQQLSSNLCVKSKLEELRGHKVVLVMSRKFDLFHDTQRYPLKYPQDDIFVFFRKIDISNWLAEETKKKIVKTLY